MSKKKTFLVVDGTHFNRITAIDVDSAIMQYAHQYLHMDDSTLKTNSGINVYRNVANHLSDIRCYELVRDEQFRLSSIERNHIANKIRLAEACLIKSRAEKEKYERIERDAKETRKREIALMKALQAKYPEVLSDEDIDFDIDFDIHFDESNKPKFSSDIDFSDEDFKV